MNNPALYTHTRHGGYGSRGCSHPGKRLVVGVTSCSVGRKIKEIQVRS
jgi:hypothetical protein